MTLRADGEAIRYAVLNDDNDWTETVEGLPKYKAGAVRQEIKYTWTEDTVPAGYAAGEPKETEEAGEETEEEEGEVGEADDGGYIW
jgi:hypothetical protein